MEHITVKAAADKWGISVRRVQNLCAQGRVPGVISVAHTWMIPANAEKPADPRRNTELHRQMLLAELISNLDAIAEPMPKDNPDAILKTARNELIRRQFETTLAYLRGDFGFVLKSFDEAQGNDIAKGCIAPFAIAAAVSLGKFEISLKIEDYYRNRIQNGPKDAIAHIEELTLSSAAISAIAPSRVPEWISRGDFSSLPVSLLTDAFQKRSRYLLSINQPEAALAVAETALSLCPSDKGITFSGIYLRLNCASACFVLMRMEECKVWLLETADICLPHGFITPFSEMITGYGGLAEECIRLTCPDRLSAVLRQCEQTIKNWITYHNCFTQENIPIILSMREIHIAQLAARGLSYAKIAEQQGVSVAAIKKNLQKIYAKLFVSNRTELTALISYRYP